MPNEARSIPTLTEAQHRKLAHIVMRRQAKLSLLVAAVFIVLLLGLPLVNYLLPDLANQRLYGFTLSWLLLGVLFYPITVLLSFYFVRESDRLEAECSDWRTVLGEEAVEMREEELELERRRREGDG